MKRSLKLYADRYPLIINSGLFLISIIITFAGLELIFRVWLSYYKPALYTELSLYHQTAQSDHSSLRFEPHPYLSYSRTDTQYESDGITIADEFYAFQKPEGVIRVACLGGSTTMGQHPRFLKRYLEYQWDSPEYEVMDFGVDSWTSQESIINYMIRIKDFSPDILLIHHGVNDSPPRIWGDFNADYSNFRISWQDQTGWTMRFFSRYSFLVNGILYLKGIMPFDLQNYVIKRLPPSQRMVSSSPETIHSYQRNIQSLANLARENGTEIVLAPVNYHPDKTSAIEAEMIDEHNQFLVKYAKENQITSVDTKWMLHQNQDWFLDSVHLKPAGILMNTQLFAAAIQDVLRGFAEVIDLTDNLTDNLTRKDRVHFDENWVPHRRIRLKWGLHISGVTDYHIYFRELGSTENFFLANTRDASIHSLDWAANNRLIKPDFKDGPQMGKDYLFNVFAIVGEHPYPRVGPDVEKGVFEIEDKIVYEEKK